MARPSQNLTHRLTVRFSPEEWEQLRRQSEDGGLDMAGMVRSQVMKAPMPRRVLSRSPDAKLLGLLLVALNRIGGNINQLVKLAHQTGDLTAYREALQDRSRLADAVTAVVDTLRA